MNLDKQTGYVSISFCVNNKRTTRLIHRLVAEAFLVNPDNKHTVNHIDGNKENNILNNLEWMTMQENAKHAYRNGNKRLKKSWNREEIEQLLHRRTYETTKEIMDNL